METPELPEWDDRDDDQREFGLVMPFLCVQSVGGPYDDVSFVAGFMMGDLDRNLTPRHIAATTTLIYTPMKNQADIIAMRHGYTMEVLTEDDEWLQVGFTRNDSLEQEIDDGN